MGYWYNGYYSGLLIRQIRVQIPGSPFQYVRRIWDRSGLQIPTWMVRLHLCTLCLIRSIGEDRGTSNPPIRVQVLYETSGYVAKRICTGLLTRETQVQPLSCPLDALMM